MAGSATITERRAANAARQLLYHRERLEWMEEKMAENETLLERLLVESDEELTALPGGYAVRLEPEGSGRLAVRRLRGAGGYEQLELGVG